MSSEQYEAVGKLVLAFNSVEAVIDEYLPYVIGAPEWRVAEFFAGRDEGFTRKAGRLATVVKLIADHFAPLGYVTNAIANLPEDAKTLANSRNQYVHALVVFDFRTNETKIRKRIGKVDHEEVPNAADLIALATQAHDLAMRLDNELGNLLGNLVDLRPK